jgi:hypothetical protein
MLDLDGDVQTAVVGDGGTAEDEEERQHDRVHAVFLRAVPGEAFPLLGSSQ